MRRLRFIARSQRAPLKGKLNVVRVRHIVKYKRWKRLSSLWRGNYFGSIATYESFEANSKFYSLPLK